VTDRLIRITTALAVVAVAVVAAVISYQHAFELVRSHGESGVTARLVPFTVDGLIWAASMVVLVGSFELLMMLIRTGRRTPVENAEPASVYQAGPPLAHEAPRELSAAPTLEQTVRARYEAGRGQRAIARELDIDRRKIKRILDQAA
jgi:hypothetical protein